jgi:Ca2+-binding RTX toxin-like protein
MGGISVDLTAADQITTFDGAANATAQTGFENVDLSAYANNGAVIVGAATASTITGTAGTDNISSGKGDDTINVTSTAASANDIMDGGAGTGDTIHILATTDFADTDANITNIEKVTMANGTITVDLTGQSEGFTITGGTGDDTITGGTGVDTITSGTGEDTFVISLTTGADIITDISTGANADAFAAASIEAITTEDTTFAKLAAGAAVYDVGVTAGVISAAVNVANAATMSVSDVNTLLITTLTKTITAASDGEKAVLLVSTDYDSALVDTYMYVIEHDGTDIDGVTLLGTLKTTELDNLSATNFDGFA